MSSEGGEQGRAEDLRVRRLNWVNRPLHAVEAALGDRNVISLDRFVLASTLSAPRLLIEPLFCSVASSERYLEPFLTTPST